MPKSMIEVHEAGQHEQYPRKRCPLCRQVVRHDSLLRTLRTAPIEGEANEARAELDRGEGT